MNDFDWATTAEAVHAILDFVESHLGWIFAFTVLFLARKSIPGLAERIINLDFTWGEASGKMQLAPPTQNLPSSVPQSSAPEPQPQPQPPEATLALDTESDRFWYLDAVEAVAEGDLAAAQRIFEAEEATTVSADAKIRNEAVYLHLLYTRAGDIDALNKLRELYESNSAPQLRQGVAYWLAKAYEKARNYEAALAVWRELVRVSSGSSETDAVVSFAEATQAAGNSDAALTLLEAQLQKAATGEERALLYGAIANLQKQLDNEEARAIALEKALEFTSGDPDRIFSAAYSQSEGNLRLLAAGNYAILVGLNRRHHSALNNLGVCAGELGLKGKQIALYKAAKELGETLAMSNLAGLFLDAGFWEEAGAILEEARQSDSTHRNVGLAIARLAQAKDEEEERWAKLQNQAEDLRRNIRAYGTAYYDISFSDDDWRGVWYDSRGNAQEFNLSNSQLVIEWTSSDPLDAKRAPDRHTLKGRCTRGSARLRYDINRNVDRRSLFGSMLDQTFDCFAYLDQSRTACAVFSADPERRTFMRFTKECPAAT